jgi:hypothetical protein
VKQEVLLVEVCTFYHSVVQGLQAEASYHIVYDIEDRVLEASSVNEREE